MREKAASAIRRLAGLPAAAARRAQRALARCSVTRIASRVTTRARPPRAAVAALTVILLPATVAAIPRAPLMVPPRICAGRQVPNHWAPAPPCGPVLAIPADWSKPLGARA